MFAACKIHQEQGVRGESETVAYLLQEHAAAYERQVLCGHPAQIYIYQVRYRDGGHHIPYAFPESEPGERDASQYSAQQQSYHSERTLGETDLAGGQSQSSCIYGVDQEQRGYSVVTRAVQKPDKLEALGWRAEVDVEEGLRRTLLIKRGEASGAAAKELER